MKPQIKWTDEKIEYLKQNYGKNNLTELSNFFKISIGAVKDAARRFGFKSIDTNIENKLKPLLIDNIFNWYWYGFICGDGNFSKSYVRITLKKNDDTHLKKLSDYLNVNLNYKNDTVTICVGDIKNINELKDKIGIELIPKTYNPVKIIIPEDNDLFFSYVIGLIDADGCIEVAKTNKARQLKIELHSSWINNLEIINDFLKKYIGVIGSCKINKRGYALFKITGHKNILKIKKKSEELSINYLNRKWDKIDDNSLGCNFFDEIKEQVIKLYNEGNNLHKISKILNVNYNSLNNHKNKIIKNKFV